MRIKGTLVILIIDANYNVTQDIITKSVKKIAMNGDLFLHVIPE